GAVLHLIPFDLLLVLGFTQPLLLESLLLFRDERAALLLAHRLELQLALGVCLALLFGSRRGGAFRGHCLLVCTGFRARDRRRCDRDRVARVRVGGDGVVRVGGGLVPPFAFTLGGTVGVLRGRIQ